MKGKGKFVPQRKQENGLPSFWTEKGKIILTVVFLVACYLWRERLATTFVEIRDIILPRRIDPGDAYLASFSCLTTQKTQHFLEKLSTVAKFVTTRNKTMFVLLPNQTLTVRGEKIHSNRIYPIGHHVSSSNCGMFMSASRAGNSGA